MGCQKYKITNNRTTTGDENIYTIQKSLKKKYIIIIIHEFDLKVKNIYHHIQQITNKQKHTTNNENIYTNIGNHVFNSQKTHTPPHETTIMFKEKLE